METALHHEERLARMEQQQARIEAMLAALSQRLDDAIITQLRDHGKRIRDIEDHIARMSESFAQERGRQAGSRATLVCIMTVISGLGGCVGAIIGRFF